VSIPAAVAVILVFAACLGLFGVDRIARGVAVQPRDTLRVLQDRSLGKERRLRALSVRLRWALRG